MRKTVESFVHRPGVYCESSAVRDILEYDGLKLSVMVARGRFELRFFVKR